MYLRHIALADTVLAPALLFSHGLAVSSFALICLWEDRAGYFKFVPWQTYLTCIAGVPSLSRLDFCSYQGFEVKKRVLGIIFSNVLTWKLRPGRSRVTGETWWRSQNKEVKNGAGAQVTFPQTCPLPVSSAICLFALVLIPVSHVICFIYGLEKTVYLTWPSTAVTESKQTLFTLQKAVRTSLFWMISLKIEPKSCNGARAH